MSDNQRPEDSKDRLIELLQSGSEQLVSEELLADLSDDELHEFQQARQAIRLLEMANPAGNPHLDNVQPAIETATMLDARTAALAGSVKEGHFPGIKNLGHYEILETLGQGGFGIVVRARDTKLGRTVALKIPKLDTLLQGQEARDRFAREARLVAMLGHPAIVPIYETGSDGPMLFIASAYCNGGQLAQWFSGRDKKIAPILAAKIVARLAEAVQHAHSRGVVHRDLKPGNVLLDFVEGTTDQDDQSIVDALRITDFGLAKVLSEDQALTQTGATIGTPAYMSPEQAIGAVEKIGPAADIYALGAILYELLSGRPPIVGQSIVATMRAIEIETPVSPRQQNSEVPRDLEAICLKCLEKNPLKRYGSAQLLEDDLRRMLRGEPVHARRIGSMTRLNRWVHRNPLVATAVSIAFASLAIGLAFSIAFGIRADRASKLATEKQNLAERKSAEALTQAKLARGAVDRLQRAIAQEPKLLSEGMEKFKLNLAAAATDYYQLVSTQQPDDPDVLREYIDTLKSLAYLSQLVGNHEDATVIWGQAAVIMQEEFPDDLVGWAAIRSKLAEDKLLTGKTVEAVEITNELVIRLERAAMETGSEDVLKNLAFQLINAAQNLNHQGSPNQAEPLVDRAIELVNLLTGKNPDQWPVNRTWARILRCKSETANKLEKHEEVDRFASRAIELYMQIMSDEPNRTSEALDSMASMHQNLGTSKQQRGQFDQAIVEFENGEKLLQQLMQRHPDVAGLSFNWSNHIHRYAQALFEAGRFEEADRMLAPHLDWLSQRQEQYPQLIHLLRISEVECRSLMSEIDAQQDRMEASALQLDQAIEVCEEECKSEQAPKGLHAFLGKLYTQKAKQMLDNDQAEPAIRLLNQSIDILQPIVAEIPSGDPAKFLRTAENLLRQANDNK